MIIRPYGHCVLLVRFPISWVIDDVLANSVQGLLVTNDVIVIVALPYVEDIGILSAPFRYANLEAAKDRTDCSGW